MDIFEGATTKRPVVQHSPTAQSGAEQIVRALVSG